MTRRNGRRSLRRAQRSSNTDNATTSGSSLNLNPPRSSTVAAGRLSMISTAERLSPAQISQLISPRFSILRAMSLRAGSLEARSSGRTRPIVPRAEDLLEMKKRVVLHTVDQRVQAKHSRLRPEPQGGNRTRGLSSAWSPGRRIRRSRRASASAAAGCASSRISLSRTKSAFGSKMIMGSSVCSRSSSRSTPRAYVFPEPLWPHQKVCRLKRCGIRPAVAPGTVVN